MTGSQSLGVVHDDLDAGTAAAAAVAAGEKKEVALLPAVKEELSTRKQEACLLLLHCLYFKNRMLNTSNPTKACRAGRC